MAEQSGTNKPEQSTGAGNSESKEMKEILRKEENLVQKAGEYVSELKFLISEIDKKKENLG